MKKTKLLLVAIAIFASYSLSAQMAVTTDGSSADGSAMLEVKSTTKGFLPPRMNETERDAITSPVTGLIIYQTDNNVGLYYYDGSAWAAVGGPFYSVGDFAQGGVVFWVDDTKQHGLVCAITDQDGGNGKAWSSVTDYTGVFGDGVYAGEMNTSILNSKKDGNTSYNAASTCANYNLVTGDWYLPSKEELYLMYQNKTTINATATSNGGSNFATTFYWSSTENSSDTVKAWACSFDNFPFSGLSSLGKSSSCRIRTIRAF